MSHAFGPLGQWSYGSDFRVEKERAIAYALATNDRNPRHLAGELASPLFAVVPAEEAMDHALTLTLPVDLSAAAVHGEQDMYFHRPIRPGMTLRCRAAPVGIHGKGSGTTVVFKVETSDDRGGSVNTQYHTVFARGSAHGENLGERAPHLELPPEGAAAEPLARIKYRIDADQTYRYAKVSGDYFEIHLDPALARAAGLPGIIVHGLCTLAFASRAVVAVCCDGDSDRLKRLGARFSRPVLPDEEITTLIWRAWERDGRRVYGFQTVNQAGEAVIKNGTVEVASP